MTRPRDITIFAGLAIGACLLNMATTLIVTRFARIGVEGSMLGLTIVAILLFWTIRGRSLAGRLVISAWLAFCIITSLSGFAMTLFGREGTAMNLPVTFLALVTLALNCAAIVFLWKRAATDWFLAKANKSA